jgi:hypothetical protein
MRPMKMCARFCFHANSAVSPRPSTTRETTASSRIRPQAPTREGSRSEVKPTRQPLHGLVAVSVGRRHGRAAGAGRLQRAHHDVRLSIPRETVHKGCFGDKPGVVMCSFASDDGPREGERSWCGSWRQRSSRPVLSLRHPPARLLAMIWPNIAAKAGSLITSFSWMATVRAVLLSWPPVMIRAGLGTIPPS